MRRLPAFGTAVFFLATFAVSAVVSADPIRIELAAKVETQKSSPPMTALPNGLPFPGLGLGSFGAVQLGSNDFSSSSFGQSSSPVSATFNGTSAGYALDSSFHLSSSGFMVASTSSSSSGKIHNNASSNAGGSASGGGNPASGGGSANASSSAAGSSNLVLPDNAKGGANAVVGVSTSATAPLSAPGASSLGESASVVAPEPASMVLFGSGLALAAYRARRRRLKDRAE